MTMMMNLWQPVGRKLPWNMLFVPIENVLFLVTSTGRECRTSLATMKPNKEHLPLLLSFLVVLLEEEDDEHKVAQGVRIEEGALPQRLVAVDGD